MNIKKNTLNTAISAVTDLIKEKGKSKKNFLLLTVCLSVFFIGCTIVLADLPFAPNGSFEHYLVTIGEYGIIDDRYDYFDSVGYIRDKKEDSNNIGEIDTNTFNSDKPYTIDYTQPGNNRWIPYWEGSTGNFKIYGDYEFDSYGNYEPLKDVGILPFKDPFNNNSGSGGIELWAVFSEDIYPNGVPFSFERLYFYMAEMSYGEAHSFILTCEIVDETDDGEVVYITNDFKLERSGTLSFGDDLALNFKIKQDDGSDIVTFQDAYSYEDNFVHFLAVYDDRLLDEANMYIDEGADDWNNYQTPIKSWTHWNDNSMVTDAVAYGWGCADSVDDFNDDMEDQKETLNWLRTGGYSSTIAPGNDWGSYAEGEANGDLFNALIDSDGTEYTLHYDADGSLDENNEEKIWYFDMPLNTSEVVYTLDCGTADFDLYGKLGSSPTTSNYDWRSYTSGGENITFLNPEAGWWYILVHRYSGDSAYNLDIDITYTTGTSQPYYPFRPGFSAKEDEEDQYQDSDVVYTAGVDCSGFVQRSMNYSDTQYNFGSNDYYKIGERLLWDNDGDYGQNGTYHKMGTTQFADYSSVIDINQLVPGDILLRTGLGSHIVIVQGIDFLGDSRTVEEGNVTVIEATQGPSPNYVWKVMKTRKWSNFINFDLYIPRRLDK